MSEDQVKKLQDEKAKLEVQLTESTNNAHDLSVQRDANNSFMSEVITDNLIKRATIIHRDNALQQANQKLNGAQGMITALNNQLTVANAKLKELEAKIVSLAPPPKAELELVDADKEQKSA